MKLLYSHPSVIYVDMMRSLLANERIPTVIRNHRLMGEGTFGATPELWVAEEDLFLAQSIISDYQSASQSQLEDWVCSQCGAKNDGRIGICWNCDYEIDGPDGS